MLDRIENITTKLLDYCQANDWAGHDPYDALNSNILKHLFFVDSRIPRLALTQLIKTCPLNLRPLLRVPKAHNPKAIALFLMALLKLSPLGLLREKDLVDKMVEKLRTLRSRGAAHRGWGYSFPWQTRTKIVPRGTPNLVCTVFAANALLDAFEANRDPECLAMAEEASELIVREFYWTEGGTEAGFGYPLPSIREYIHNANFLGAAFLCRAYRFTGDKRCLATAFDVARSSASKQHDEGSWFYGESERTRWIDNFHTGYNLVGLRDIRKYGQTTEFDSHIQKGLQFYIKHFFREDGAAKYFHDRAYPIDVHCVAQSLLTLLAFKDVDEAYLHTALRVLRWAVAHMWDENGYFYYQVRPLFTNKTPYMRWSQAWMLLALSTVLEGLTPENERLSLDKE